MPRPIRHPRSPYWQYDFQRGGRRFHGSTGTASRAAAQTFIDRLCADIAAGRRRGRALTLDEALGSYWRAVAAAQPSARTTRSQMQAILRILRPALLAPELEPRDLAEYVARRRASVSDATVNRELQCLRRALRWCEATLGAEVPAIGWAGLMLREPRERVRALSADEEARLFAALREDLHPLARFALATGLRLGSARTLTWDRVDLAGGRVRVSAKGGKVLEVPVTPATVAMLANLPREEGVAEVFTWRPRGARRLRPVPPDGWRKSWAAALAAAGIPDFRWHDLRHTFATRWRRAGGDILALRRMLGHEDLSSTQRYAHVDEADLREGLARVEARNSPGPHRGRARKVME